MTAALDRTRHSAGSAGRSAGPRLVASDVDGTLMRPDGVISERTRAACRAVRDAGLEMVFVTGRPIRWLGPLEEQLGHCGTVICSNGAVVWDMSRRKVLFTEAFGREQALQLQGVLRALHPAAGFSAELVTGPHREPEFLRLHPSLPVEDQVTGPLGTTLPANARVVKLLAISPVLTAEEFHALVAPAVKGLAHVTYSDVNRVALLEFSLPGVTKARTLEAFAKSRGIGASEVIAFGDMPNDVQMLAWAGEGYAMADGHPEARAAARFEAPRCRDDGVALVLESVLAG
ncbi:HAD family hydrolase [Arthrobacter sp. NPDC090010]|uniref:HAD family hydrolase n=1 Tax=Arthrobacter sp. NPDC090010 TaxID=3363942 RepID=UPI0038229BAD